MVTLNKKEHIFNTRERTIKIALMYHQLFLENAEKIVKNKKSFVFQY